MRMVDCSTPVTSMPKPEVLIPYLRGLPVDTQATRHHEMMSGGFLWSEEGPAEGYSEMAGDYAMRFLLGYRASLTRGQPREELRFVWDAVLSACSEWPGFLVERRSPVLAEELAQVSRAEMRHLTALDHACSKIVAQRGAVSPQPTVGKWLSHLLHAFLRR